MATSKMKDNKDYVYEPRMLTGYEREFFCVPKEIIHYPDKNLVAVFLFFSVRRGRDNMVDFTIDRLVSWCGYSPDSHKGMINDKIRDCVSSLVKLGYISIPDESQLKQNSKIITAAYNVDHLQDVTARGNFGKIYLDEILKLVENPDLGCTLVLDLRIFAYLRSMIKVRGNLREKYSDPKKHPEVFVCTFAEIAKEFGINKNTLTKIMNTLKDAGLIYVWQYMKKNKDNRLSTLTSLFCNTYKREYGNEVAYGEDYYLKEIENQCKLLG